MGAFPSRLLHLTGFGRFAVSTSQENEDPNIMLTFHKLVPLKSELFLIRK